MTTIQNRYLTACKLGLTRTGNFIHDEYIRGRMSGVAWAAEQRGYTGDELNIRLQLLTEVLAAKKA